MRIKSIVLGLLLVTNPDKTLAQSQPPGAIWKNGRSSILVVPCPPGGDHDASCRAVEVHRAGRVIRLGGGYEHVNLLWNRQPGQTGPDALVLGNDGGSGGAADLFAVTFAPRIAVRILTGERMEGVVVRRGSGPLQLDLSFNIEFFNGASHAGVKIVRLPVRWSNGDFSVDLAALTGRSFSSDELDFHALAMEREFHQWAEEAYPAPRLFPPEAPSGTPVAVQSLADLMLSGHADQASRILHRTWPRSSARRDVPLGGEDAFWAALCHAIVDHPLWKRFDLGRLPHADLMETGRRLRT